jgi:hypothetical protein
MRRWSLQGTGIYSWRNTASGRTAVKRKCWRRSPSRSSKLMPDGMAEPLRKQLALVADDHFRHLAEHATPVNAACPARRPRKTVARGALWYEETLPPETLLYTGLNAVNARQPGSELTGGRDPGAIAGNLFGAHPYLQLGGNETVGMGWCRATFLPAAAGREDQGQERLKPCKPCNNNAPVTRWTRSNPRWPKPGRSQTSGIFRARRFKSQAELPGHDPHERSGPGGGVSISARAAPINGCTTLLSDWLTTSRPTLCRPGFAGRHHPGGYAAYRLAQAEALAAVGLGQEIRQGVRERRPTVH